ncbi:DUF6153 family protein [Lacisediminihabitans sp. H27-G8]|uniref:DUF6153 family protein n=1 Tax=Lacisediminihabitans sp. H27-G8 TaxID=3111909 RepID=UPI0038FCC05B
MSLIRACDWILNPSALRKTLLLLTVVVAVVAGLLAMHTISSSMGDHAGGTGAAGAMPPAMHHADAMAPTGGSSAGSQGCSGLCDPGQVMTTMACVIALLATAVMVAGTRRTEWAGLPRRPRSFLRPAIAAAASAILPAPNLDALSISRT